MLVVAFPKRLQPRYRSGFTILELLVATTILALLLVVLLSVTNQATTTVKQANFKIEAFASARGAQDLVAQRLSQATLNTYWDYYNASGKNRTVGNASSFVPAKFGRASDLQFLVIQNTQTMATSGQEIYFQTPEAYSNNQNYQSTQGLLNSCGYFVRYGDDSQFCPTPALTLSRRWRYRLMQGMKPTESFQNYSEAASGTTSWATALSDTTSTFVRPVADNVIAMIVWSVDPKGDSLTSDFTYNSKGYIAASTDPTKSVTANQLPPTVQITFVVIDEPSANRIDTHSSTPPAVIASALSGKFVISTDTQFKSDLNDLAAKLNDSHINYRIFTSSVVLRESKWSK